MTNQQIKDVTLKCFCLKPNWSQRGFSYLTQHIKTVFSIQSSWRWDKTQWAGEMGCCLCCIEWCVIYLCSPVSIQIHLLKWSNWNLKWNFCHITSISFATCMSWVLWGENQNWQIYILLVSWQCLLSERIPVCEPLGILLHQPKDYGHIINKNIHFTLYFIKAAPVTILSTLGSSIIGAFPLYLHKAASRRCPDPP